MEEKDEIGQLLHLMDESTKESLNTSDRALWHLLKQYEDDLPCLNDQFHETFRTCDVTGNYHIDTAIWVLLSGSVLFWRLYGEVLTGTVDVWYFVLDKIHHLI